MLRRRSAGTPLSRVGGTATLLLCLLATEPAGAGDTNCCNAELNFGFSREALSADQPFEGLSGHGAACLGNDGEWIIEGEKDHPATAAVFVNVVSQLENLAVEGWSVSLEITGAARITDATTDGTTGALSDGQGFNSTGVVDPSLNDGRDGAVSAVILCFGCEGSLPSRGTESVLRLSVESDSVGDEELTARLFHEDGLRLAGQPVTNRATLSGRSTAACNSTYASLSLSFVPAEARPFVRGDVNADGGVNIADPIYLLNHLFGGGPPATCEESSDINDDGAVNIADPIYELNSLFGGGAPVAAPHPECGAGADPEALPCLAFAPCAGA